MDHKTRARVGIGAAVLLGVVALVVVWSGFGSAPPVQAPVALALPVADPASAASGPASEPAEPAAVVPMPAVPSRAAPSAPAALPPEEAARRAAWEQRQRQIAEVERQWCSSAKATHLQLEAAKAQSLPKFDPKNPTAYMDAVEASTKGEMPLTREARASASNRLYNQWAQQLRQRSDPASRRVLLWLGATQYLPLPNLEHDASRAILKTLADTHNDPQAYALWLHASRFCFQGHRCSAADYQRWAQVDPGNLLAWLPALGDQAPLTPERWQGLARTQFVRDPVREVFEVLLPLVPTEPGLLAEVGLEELDRLQGRLGQLSPAQALSTPCGKATTPEQRQACAHAADLLERQPAVSFFDRMGSMALRAMASDDSTRESQLKRLQASFEALQPQQLEALKAALNPDFAKRPGCDHFPAWREHLQRVHTVGSAAMVEALAPLR